MIIGRAQTGRRDALIVGLTGENIARLVAGEPILKQDLVDIGFEHDLVILYGKTDEDVTAAFRQIEEAGRG